MMGEERRGWISNEEEGKGNAKEGEGRGGD